MESDLKVETFLVNISAEDPNRVRLTQWIYAAMGLLAAFQGVLGLVRGARWQWFAYVQVVFGLLFALSGIFYKRLTERSGPLATYLSVSSDGITRKTPLRKPHVIEWESISSVHLGTLALHVTRKDDSMESIDLHFSYEQHQTVKPQLKDALAGHLTSRDIEFTSDV